MQHGRAKLLSKGYYPASFRSVFGDEDVRIRRLRACRCRAGPPKPKSFGAMFATGGVWRRRAGTGLCDREVRRAGALLPGGRHYFELLPVAGAANAGAVRNRTMRVGARLANVTAEDAPAAAQNMVTPPVIVVLDGGHVRSRDLQERNFEVIACKVIDPGGTQHRFAFARNGGSAAQLGARPRRGEPISTAFVENAVNETVSCRMIKKQQMRWNRWTVQPFLDVRAAVLNGAFEGSFRRQYPDFRPANTNHQTTRAA